MTLDVECITFKDVTHMNNKFFFNKNERQYIKVVMWNKNFTHKNKIKRAKQ